MDSVGRIECRLSWKMVIQSRFFKPKRMWEWRDGSGGGGKCIYYTSVRI